MINKRGRWRRTNEKEKQEEDGDENIDGDIPMTNTKTKKEGGGRTERRQRGKETKEIVRMLENKTVAF